MKTYYCLSFFLLVSFSLCAISPNWSIHLKTDSLTVKEFLNLPIEGLERIQNRKFNWREKKTVKRFKKKLMKRAQKNPEILKHQVYDYKKAGNKLSLYDLFGWVLLICLLIVIFVLLIYFLLILIGFPPEID